MAINDLERMYSNFKEQAEALSAKVYRVADPAGAGRQFLAILKKLKVNKVVAAVSGLVQECLNAAGTGGIMVYTDNLRQHAEDAVLGLSEMDLAIAETGTLVQDSTSLDRRLVSTLPPVHVALVPTGKLVEKFGDAIEYLNEKRGDMPGYIAFISGPSRTADIERVLTIGVHGPGELHIIFIDKVGDEPGER